MKWFFMAMAGVFLMLGALIFFGIIVELDFWQRIGAAVICGILAIPFMELALWRSRRTGRVSAQ